MKNDDKINKPRFMRMLAKAALPLAWWCLTEAIVNTGSLPRSTK